MSDRHFITPPSLSPGDRIAIVSPASIINPEFVNGAMTALESQGWHPYASTHSLGRSGSYSGTIQQRKADLVEALLDPTTRAIFCSRGGYGMVHLLDDKLIDFIRSNPKWIIGFSDISALHAAASCAGVESLHASMCKQLTTHGVDNFCNQSLFNILRGQTPHYTAPCHRHNKRGLAQGRLVGGNLAVLSALIATPYDMLDTPDCILFIEDIAEPIYKVERILYQLRLSGRLSRIRGLIIGQFTEYQYDRNYNNMYDMIHDMTNDLNIPIAFNFPIGHIDENIPLIVSRNAMLSVDDNCSILSFTSSSRP